MTYYKLITLILVISLMNVIAARYNYEIDLGVLIDDERTLVSFRFLSDFDKDYKIAVKKIDQNTKS